MTNYPGFAFFVDRLLVVEQHLKKCHHWLSFIIIIVIIIIILTSWSLLSSWSSWSSSTLTNVIIDYPHNSSLSYHIIIYHYYYHDNHYHCGHYYHLGPRGQAAPQKMSSLNILTVSSMFDEFGWLLCSWHLCRLSGLASLIYLDYVYSCVKHNL